MGLSIYNIGNLSSLPLWLILIVLGLSPGCKKFEPERVIITYGDPVSDIDSNEYKTVHLGSQIWMAENLKTTMYADGSAIPLVQSASEWDALTTSDKAYCWYDNSPANRDTYGGLYTLAAAMNGVVDTTLRGVQGVCPDGWHLPNAAEWTELTNYLGGSSVGGGKLKESGTTHWSNPNSGATNESGFTALPGGERDSSGYFGYLGYSGHFWMSAENGASFAYFRILLYNDAGVEEWGSFGNMGFSVRCVKD